MNIDKAIRLNERFKAAQATEKDRDRAMDKAHDYVLLGYTLLNAADIILRETEKVMSSVGPERRYEDTFHITESIRDIRKVIQRNDMFSQHFDSVLADIGPNVYDGMRNNAYEILRFVMLLFSRTCGDQKATNQLEAYMHRMKSNGIFSEEEISKFKMK